MEAVYKLKGKQKVQKTNGLTLLFKCLASQMWAEIEVLYWSLWFHHSSVPSYKESGKGYFCDSWSALFFLWNMKWSIFSSWIVISIAAMKHDFHYVFVFRGLWKDRFIFCETWSRPPLYYL